MTISGDKNIKTALTDLRDIGPYVTKCITDTRTLNKYVFCYGELLSQDELFDKMEELSGEIIEREYVRLLPDCLFSFWTPLCVVKWMNEDYWLYFADKVSPDQLLALCDATKVSFRYDLSDMKQAMTVIGLEYSYSKFVRGDNSPEYAKYLGYLDARDLYPDFVPRSFEAFAKEVVDGKAAKIF